MSNNRALLVREVLTSYLDRHNLQARVQQASVINDWEKLVGVQLAKVTEPDSIDRDGTLRVRVQSAAWLQELQLTSPTIIAELAKQGRTIKRIWWSLGPVREHEGAYQRRSRRGAGTKTEHGNNNETGSWPTTATAETRG